MRIATFNINNINKRFDNLLDWLAETQPDVVCLQELKSTDASFPAKELADFGYHAVWRGEPTWNGVAILTRHNKPILIRSALPGNPRDVQARYIEAAVNGVIVASIYLPNGNPCPGPKFAYKLAWFDRLIDHAATLIATSAPIVLAGDFNVVPTEADIYQPHSWQGDALLQPESRAAWRQLLDQGWTDGLKSIHPEGPLWTFWAYLRERWPNDKGLRLDHILLSPTVASRLQDAGVDRWVRGEPDASDHAPAWAEIDASGAFGATTGNRQPATGKPFE